MQKYLNLGLAAAAGFLTLNSYALTVDTPNGKQTLPENPQRIVVLDLGLADDLLVLGQQSRVVGIPNSNFYPSYLDEYKKDQYKKVGLLNAPDLETIANLKPDLIIISSRTLKFAEQLKDIAPLYNVNLDDTKSYQSIVNNFETIAKLTGTEAKAKELLATLDKKIAAAKAKVVDANALLTLANDRKISGYNRDSRFGILYQEFGFKPTVEIKQTGRHGTEISYEFINKANPQYIFVVDRTAAISTDGSNARAALDNPLVAQTIAGKQNGIYFLDAKVWYLAYGGYLATDFMVNEIEQAVKQFKK